MPSSRSASASVLVAVLAIARPARPDAPLSPRASATLTCDRAAEPGRLRCAVEARATPGLVIRWGDVVLLDAPAFVLPLKGRIGPHDATVREEAIWRWAFALVARDRGTGDLHARVRLVLCEGDRCAPATVDVATALVVGG